MLLVGALALLTPVANALPGVAHDDATTSDPGVRAAQAGAASAVPAADTATSKPRVLVFRGPASRQEDAVGKATSTIKQLGADHGFVVEVSEDPGELSGGNLSRFRSVVFLSSVGADLSGAQLGALRRYVRGGGGFLGIHDAAKAEPDNDWFTGLVGTRPAADSPFKVQSAVVDVLDRQHPATRDLALNWKHSDRWYNWAPNPVGTVHTVAQVEESSYAPGTAANGPFHPVSWCRDYDGGRSFYTGMGATSASYDDDDFRSHLLGAVEWTSGMVRGDCKATIASNYKTERLTGANQSGQLDQIGEPHGLTIAEDGTVFYIGKAACPSGPIVSWDDPKVGLGCGTIHQWDPDTKKVTLLTTLDVMGNRGSGDELVKNEEGLVGITLDPDFATNHWIYVYWMPHESIDRDAQTGERTISRFTYDPSGPSIDKSSRKDLLHWTTQIHSCCHAGGGMAFDKAGNLYVGSGDNNSSLGSGGYSGNNWTADYKGISFQDARRTAGNTNNLNGKIIRIHPEDDGTYTIPAGNLFTGAEGGGGKARPEIYVMGVRNIARLAIDPDTQWLTAGWVGPDAGGPSTTWGPAKYETASVITSAGNQGWPYCMGNKQPYRDRSNDDATQPTGWYDCDHPKNTSPRNTGLVDLPPVRANNIWYSPQGGGPVYPARADGSGVPTYEQSQATYTEPYLKGGGQAIMSGPTFRESQVDPDSTVAWPSYWEGKWFIGDESNSKNRIAATMTPDAVLNHTKPAYAEDLRQIIRPGTADDQVMSFMDAKFGPDGALYVLDYGGGFFSLDSRQKLVRITYQGGAPTPTPAVTSAASGQGTPTTMSFSGAKAGGVSWKWSFGDGTTSTRMNPTHTFTQGGRQDVALDVTYADGTTAHVSRSVNVRCPAADSNDTVRFLDRDSGVANQEVGGGCTVNDVVDDESSWGSHDQFVSYVEALTKRMQAQGTISSSQKWALDRAAAASPVGDVPGYTPLYDGSRRSLADWEQAPSGSFSRVAGGAIRSSGGMGMLWYGKHPFGDFSLRLQFRDVAPEGHRANSGVFTRFPDPRTPLEQRPAGSCGTQGAARTSQAWVAVYCGQEIQIYDGDTGEPQKTGSVYNFDSLGIEQAEVTDKGVWNNYEVRVVGQHYTIWRNGVRLNTFDNTPGKQSSRAGDPPTDLRQFLEGYIGLQNHSDNDLVEFRNIRLRPL